MIKFCCSLGVTIQHTQFINFKIKQNKTKHQKLLNEDNLLHVLVQSY